MKRMNEVAEKIMSNSQNPMIQHDAIEKYFFILLRFDSSSKKIASESRIATYYLPPEFKLTEKISISKLNQTLNEPTNYYPYKKAGSTQTAIDTYKKGYPINKREFNEANSCLNSAISKISNHSKEKDYPKELLDAEKRILFTKKSGFQWISFPVISRGLCFAILIAQVKKPCKILNFLNKSAYTLSDNLLQNLAKYNISHPFNDITQLDDINLICSLVASQSGLESTEFKDKDKYNDIIFLGEEGGQEQEVLQLEKPYEYHRIIFKCAEEEKTKINQFLYTHKIRINRYCHRIQALTKTARAAIMARNFSHNVGSHALANPNIYKKIGLDECNHKKIKQRLEIFHSYMQGRLDFLARAISDQSDRPEPLFFLNEVMNGFFKQSVLLNTLVDDAGFPAEKIRFCVTINENEENDESAPPPPTTTYDWDLGTHCFSCKETISNDPVVGIPGGMVGTHALYAFLENILRNAVKYGAGVGKLKEKLEEKLEIHLELGQRTKSAGQQPAWILRVWDNVSNGGNIEVIRKYINTPLIRENIEGGLKSEGHGIQEMKLCAEALAGDDLRFPANQHYREGQALHCYEKEKQLVYDLLLPNPVLLGIVPLGDEVKPDTPPPYVKYYKSIDELAENGAKIGVLLDNGCGDKKDVMLKIARLHTCLPFRLMVLSEKKEDEGDKCSWTKKLEGKTLNGGVDFQWGEHIPRNRLRIHADQTLWDELKAGKPNGNTFIGCTAWEAVMLRAYDSWLRVYKKVPGNGGKWNLCIGFDHGGDTNINRWKSGVETINEANNSCIAISIVSKDGDNAQTKTLLAADIKDNWNDVNRLQVKGDIKDSILMFNNHGEAFNHPDEIKFYQTMGKEEGLTLFQSLTSPPHNALSFGLFVYSLVEGALTKVYTLDERVAEDVSNDNKGINVGKHKKYLDAGISPFVGVKTTNEKKSFFISKVKKEEYTLVLDTPSSCQNADVILIHEGVMDLLSKEKMWNRESDTQKLFTHAPFVVRVSGRGRETRHLDDAISFLEFNELSGNTYQEMNKPRLVKALLGSSGSYDAANESKLIMMPESEEK